jgi:hypothetical protein
MIYGQGEKAYGSKETHNSVGQLVSVLSTKRFLVNGITYDPSYHWPKYEHFQFIVESRRTPRADQLC